MFSPQRLITFYFILWVFHHIAFIWQGLSDLWWLQRNDDRRQGKRTRKGMNQIGKGPYLFGITAADCVIKAGVQPLQR
jgi:hypothetical protein